MLHVEGEIFADIWDYSPSCVPHHILEVELITKGVNEYMSGLFDICILGGYIFPVNVATSRACLEVGFETVTQAC